MPTPSFDDFANLFPPMEEVVHVETVPPQSLPEPYRKLLDHRFHMTVTVEQFFGDRVNVIVESSLRTGDNYCRKILLALAGSGRIVQFGMVKIDLSVLPSDASREILAERTPLGRVLIEHNILTTIEPVSFLRATLGPTLNHRFGSIDRSLTFGRIGEITANGSPAIDVLEILAPHLNMN